MEVILNSRTQGMIFIKSFTHWLSENHPDIAPQIFDGHLELFTPDMKIEYEAWRRSENGREYFEEQKKQFLKKWGME